MKTIKDIAKEAKVSIGTVDRVIHRRGGVAKKTEAKIQKIIEETGFTPNLAARNLVLKKNITIAILTPQPNAESPFWSQPLLGIQKALEELESFGFNADIHHYDQFMVDTYEQKLDTILKTNYDGLIIVPHFTKETLLRKEKLNELKIPYIFLNVNLDGFENACFIGQDSFKSGLLAGKLFNLTLTEESTVLIVNFLDNIENRHSFVERIQGLKKYCNKNEIPLKLDELQIEKFHKDDLKKYLTKKLISNNSIKGVFIPSSKISYITEYLEEFEIEMDTIIGYDITDSNIHYINNDSITFLIAQEPSNQGYESVRTIFNILVHKIKPQKNNFSPLQIITKENLDSYI